VNLDDQWICVDTDTYSGDPILLVKTLESEILDNNISTGARLCRLWIRFITYHYDKQNYTISELANDFKVGLPTAKQWLNELISAGAIGELYRPWMDGKESDSGQVYFIQSINGGPIKIGTAIDAEHRLAEFQTASCDQLQIIALIPTGGYKLESALHAEFSKFRIRGEWFSPSDELIKFINTIQPGKYLPDQ
jgi:hypothetical protein